LAAETNLSISVESNDTLDLLAARIQATVDDFAGSKKDYLLYGITAALSALIIGLVALIVMSQHSCEFSCSTVFPSNKQINFFSHLSY